MHHIVQSIYHVNDQPHRTLRFGVGVLEVAIIRGWKSA